MAGDFDPCAHPELVYGKTFFENDRFLNTDPGRVSFCPHDIFGAPKIVRQMPVIVDGKVQALWVEQKMWNEFERIIEADRLVQSQRAAVRRFKRSKLRYTKR